MKKEFEHKKIEICKLCKKEIDTELDDWATLIDYRMQNQRNIGFFHARCLNDLIKGQGKVIQERFKNKLFGTIGRIFGGGIPQEKEEMEEFIEV